MENGIYEQLVNNTSPYLTKTLSYFHILGQVKESSLHVSRYTYTSNKSVLALIIEFLNEVVT